MKKFTYRLLWILCFISIQTPLAFSNPTFSNPTIDKAKIKNQTGVTIEYLYVSPSDEGWGEDVLGEETTLEEGKTVTVSLSKHGNVCEFDIKAVAEDESEYVLWVQNLCRNNTVTLTEDALIEKEDTEETESDTSDESDTENTIRVENNTGATIFYLFARKAGTTDWGNDLMQSDQTLQNNGNVKINLADFSTTNCRFDFKGTDLDRTQETVIRNVNLCNAKTVRFSSSRNASPVPNTDNSNNNANEDNAITVENNVGETIFYLFARKAGTTDWGNDRLPSDKTLSNNSDVTVIISELSRSNCRYDVRGTDLNKTKEFIVRDVNLCNAKTVRLMASNAIITTATTSVSDEAHAIGVENQSGETIFYIFVRKTGESSWGDDRLGSSNTLQNNSDQTILITEIGGSNCRFDVKGTNLEKTVGYTLRNVDLCNKKTVRFTPANRN